VEAIVVPLPSVEKIKEEGNTLMLEKLSRQKTSSQHEASTKVVWRRVSFVGWRRE
jgi:hypothetical protein